MSFTEKPSKDSEKQEIELVVDEDPVASEIDAGSTEASSTKLPASSASPYTPAPRERQHSMEFVADKKNQLPYNYRSVDAGPVSSGLKSVFSITLCSIVYALVTHEKMELLAIQVVIVAFAFIARLIYVRRKADRQAIAKYVCGDGWVASYKCDGSEMWKANERNIQKATLFSESTGKRSLVLSTRGETFTLTGLVEPERLLEQLPEKIQTDCTGLEKKLRDFVSSLHELEDAEEMEVLRNAKQFRECLQKELANFPDTIVLPESRTHLSLLSTFTLIFIVPTVIAAFIGYAQYALPLLAVFFATFAQSISKQLSLIDRCYVFTANALFELDRKAGTVNTITLDRISLRNQDDNGADLNLEDQIYLPVHIEKAQEDFVNSCLKKYPSHFNSH
ncbi:MAG: hypothetical protein K2Y39_20755 [Candidatus Obscuribacterales bacterium]|nr:hypothetical protein [Candidatus Obscuribacterales bacterium]